MKTVAWTASVLVLFTGALHAQSVASPPALDAATGVLVVVQTPEGQQKVKEMLGRLPRR